MTNAGCPTSTRSDQGAGFEYETETVPGLWLSGPNGPFGPDPRAFGHDGFGGSCGFADPEAGVTLENVMNRTGPHIADDPRKSGACGYPVRCASNAPLPHGTAG